MTQAAPGKSHRKGITLAQLFTMFPDDATATAWVERIRWPEGPTCPHCGGVRIAHPVKHKTMTHRCRDCRKWFSVRTGTMMECSRLGLQTWVVAVYLLNTDLKGQSSMKLHRDLGVTQKTAWHLAHRIREAWEDNGGSLFAGPVEADETYIGGKRKNMPRHKRAALTGRGSAGKEAVVGIKDRATNEVRARHVETTDVANVAGFVAEQTASGAKVFSDEARVYNALDPLVRPRSRQALGRRVRARAGAHQRNREPVVDGQARPPRHLSPLEPEAPSALCQRVRRAAQHPLRRYPRSDEGDRRRHGREAAAVSGVDRLGAPRHVGRAQLRQRHGMDGR